MTEDEAKEKSCKNWANFHPPEWLRGATSELCQGSICMGWPECKAAWDRMEADIEEKEFQAWQDKKEVEERAASPLCKCGHRKDVHGMTMCLVQGCNCKKFREAT